MSVVNNAQRLWETVKSHLETEVSEVAFNSVFADTTGLYLDENCLTISVPNPFVAERIDRRFRALIGDVLTDCGYDQLSLEMRVSETQPAAEDDSLEQLTLANVGHVQPESIPAESKPVPAPIRNHLNDRYTFESFVIGSSNRFAHAAALSVAERPSKSYNPLFIYGGAGLGKTHLLQAIAHYVEANYPHYRVRYISTETMLNEFIDSIRNHTQPDFKSRYRETDVLLVDDVQFIEGKEQLQEEFFHTFNTLEEANRQIILSSDRPPDAVATLEERLRSRFKMGLVTDIQPPDFETRLAILRRKAEKGTIPIPDEVLGFIVTNVTNNIRELEGALNRITAWTAVSGQDLTLTDAERVLADIVKPAGEITPSAILSAVADYFGFTVEELVAHDRRRPLVHARQVAMYVFREITDLSYPQIGKVFGSRDHTTIIYGFDKIKDQMQKRKVVLEEVNGIIQNLKNQL